MAKGGHIGRDAFGNMVGLGDLITGSITVSKTARKMIKGIVADISAKGSFKILDENGEVMQRWSKAVLIQPHYAVLIAHADEVDNHNRSIIEWEEKNTEKAGN